MEITYDDFKKVQIKVGTVIEVKKNEKAMAFSFFFTSITVPTLICTFLKSS